MLQCCDMISLTRAMERSLESVSGEADLAQRLAEINSVGNPLKRNGLLAVHAIVARRPTLIANRLGVNFQPHDLEKIGEGVQAKVYRLPQGQVLKIVKEKLP